ncbi:MAG: response regulator transcription factor [Verrucomicrobia bacterium]|jgi:DNA-binding NarL/FixJ family response regulator|nr:response regulator transcription factor [Verrucomicrobiota bacterium]
MATDIPENIVIPSPIRTWLIEDHAVYRTNLAEALDSHDSIECKHDFSSCEEAIEALRLASEADRPHVILVDLALPGMGGIEGIGHILGIDSSIKCIVVTVSENRRTVFDAISAGAGGYLLKDAPFDKIIDGIHEVIGGGASLNGHIAKMLLDAMPKSGAAGQDYDLTEREIQVLTELAEGKAVKQIPDALGISVHTVKFHIANAYTKLHVRSQGEAVAKAVREGII